MSKFERCPCGSKALYHKCCKKYHDGELPENALLLMRSRYSAYSKDLAEYIMDTTHKDHEEHAGDAKEWLISIHLFSRHTIFNTLTISEFVDGETTATVTFSADLRQAGEDVVFSEKSDFVKEDGRWLYRSGTILES
ncbi:MAG: hypothetical protein IAF58_23265 [Leptolyngbya sp.]|nr:hypothetical protein [Candidatus Melainabacteria bacterium]